ncbi:glycosyltransferase family 4 protein [Candidatus Margulisiibacteriota bacterium]
MKIVVISHALVQDIPRKRWQILAEKYNHEVHLLVPKVWISEWFGNKRTYIAKKVENNNFFVHPLPTSSRKNWGRYFFLSLDAKFRQIQPDIIYIVHEETIWIHQQIYLYRKLWAPKAKIVFFSMNARGVPLKRFYQRWMWKNLNRNVEAALVHYPGCLESLRKAGFGKPVYLQTQVGVDEDLFRPDKEQRKQIREELGISNKFVIGYVGRLIVDKGVDDLIKALPLDGIDWALLLVGDGELREEVERLIVENNWQGRVVLCGEVQQKEVPGLMRAADCFVLASRTMPHWIDTFPLVTVQAMACGVPVVASDSASLPWQLGKDALIFPEGNIIKLKENIMKLAKDASFRRDLAERGRKRSLRNFCVKGITENFDRILKQIASDKIECHHKDEEYIQYKAYR